MYWLRSGQVSLGPSRKADAHLAAASQDMYHALEDCADSLEAEVNDRWGDDARLANKKARDMEPVLAARLALAKARGE